MDRKLIFAEGYNKYYRASLPINTTGSGNDSFEKLLVFIGKHKPYGDRDAVGSAYMAIRKKTNELLGLDWKKPVLKTSKREIAAVRFYYKSINKSQPPLFVKIPFKIAYIFKAVAMLVDEIHKEGFDVPPELKEYVDLTYARAFYSEYERAYMDSKDTIIVGQKAQKALEDDFRGPYSPLRSIFK